MDTLTTLTTRLTSHPKLLVSAVAVAAPVAYLSYLHHSLAKHTQHTRTTTLLTADSTAKLTSVPPSAFAAPHRLLHDRAWQRVRASELPVHLGGEEMLTLYLRHTMGLFARRFPQAYLLRLVVPGERRGTFGGEYIEGLGFGEGEVVGGVYRVLGRGEGRVEFGLEMGGGNGEGKGNKGVEGRLVVGVREVEEGWWECSSETAMWVKEGGGRMPLEGAVGRWMHEVAAWWLLGSGVGYLKGLRKESEGLGKGE